MVRRDPGLAPHRPSFQRTHRGNKQPAPSPAAHRPRLHQPHQLRSPRTADNMTRQPVPATLHPTLTRRAERNHHNGNLQHNPCPEFGTGVRASMAVSSTHLSDGAGLTGLVCPGIRQRSSSRDNQRSIDPTNQCAESHPFPICAADPLSIPLPRASLLAVFATLVTPAHSPPVWLERPEHPCMSHRPRVGAV